MLTTVSRFMIFVVLVAFIGSPAGAWADSHPEEARIGGGEIIDTREGSFEDMYRHEGKAEDIHHHEGRSADIHRHEGGRENLADHHAQSETLGGRSANFERLFGMENDPNSALSKARQKLLDARQRHSRAVKAAEAERSRPASPDARATRGGTSDRIWSHRLEMAKHRILVAEARVQMMDSSYADMIRNDHPRGDARQQLIDQRDQAKQRLKAEQARLPQLVAHARQQGAPESVLSRYSD